MSAVELGGALRQCGRGKSPGADGLTYEFYALFWDIVGEPLAGVCCEAFEGGEDAQLPTSMLHGIIVLVYKGAKAGPRTRAACYRPLTMLNCDYKLLAKALALRFAAPLSCVVDPTQTAFLPGRWIGDNVLQHLEEVDYLEATRNPGVVAFVDFEKAYDVVSRPWVLECMGGLGFGPRAQRWVKLLLHGTRACCRVNGFHTRDFAVRSGVAQGSPLSPLLYVIAAQPLASRLRQLQCSGRIAGIALPGGAVAPPSNQHADDTTLHCASLDDLATAAQHALTPFCAASASRTNPQKTWVMLLGGAAQGHSTEFTHTRTGFKVLARDAPVRHLGIMLGPGTVGEQAREAKLSAIGAAMAARMSHWSARTLTHDGRVHVASQCLASMLVYHATFSRPSPALLQRLHASISRFVDGGDAYGGPARVVSHLPHALGGRGAPCLPRIIDALQAGVVCRLLHPARHPWKTLTAARLHTLSPALGFFLRRDITHDACASERNPDPKNGRGGHKGQGATGAGGQKAWCHERAWRCRYGAGYGGMSKVWKKNMENRTETNIRATDQHVTHQQRRTKAQTAIESKE